VNRSYSELPVRDLRRIDPKRTTDFDDEYADSCDSMCRCWEDDITTNYDPPAVVFSLGERALGIDSESRIGGVYSVRSSTRSPARPR
jgi:hypothetical protein